jgi:L-lactate dehydrogenase complex protein LldF
MSSSYPDTFEETLSDPKLQLAIYTATGRLMNSRRNVVAPDVLPEYQELRTQAHALKKHTIENLDYYLEQVEANVERNGGKVVFCRDGDEVADFILSLAKQRGAHLLVKSKSMTTEEVDLNDRLEHNGLEAVETDLGEYIIQLAHQRPYHIVAPALHLTRYDVADIFTKKLGVERETVVEKQTMIARANLREKFLAADIGITGANFVVADSGSVVVVENEGNARLTSSAPKIHIAIAGIEKVIPRAQDLAVFLKLLGRSATGQALTVYTSFLSGPRRPGEADGPDEFYLILLDNGRTKLLADREKRESLYCIRCGACLNHCPVYRKIGGHNYPWVYSGPIGAIITPQFAGIQQDPWLPFASSLCGACAEVCPVKIDIPRILLELRAEVIEGKTREGSNRWERLAFRAWAWAMRRPKVYQALGLVASGFAPATESNSAGPRWIRSLPAFMNLGPIRAWTSVRDLPPPPEQNFRTLWRERAGTVRN